ARADAGVAEGGAFSLGRRAPEILKKAATLADQHQQAAARVMVLAVLLEMIRQAVDALGEERDLYLGRACIALVGPELRDQTLLTVDGKRHRRSPNRHTPGSHLLPRRGGFQNSFYCEEIRPEGTTTP